MPLRLTSTLCILLVSGCTSSEPQMLSPAPPTENTAISAPPPTSALIGQTGQIPATETMGAAGSQQGYNCRTVGNATLCDAPAIPSSEDTLYTN